MSLSARWFRFAVEHYMVLPLGGCIALLWANTYATSYFVTAQALAFWVNDVGLALVFAFVMQEAIEAALPGGSLHSWRYTLAPLAAAIGGIVGAVATYTGYVHAGDEAVLAQGWPVVCGIDLLVSMAIARWIFARRVQTSFLLVLALATDVIGITVSSLQPLAPGHLLAGLLIVPALATCLVLRSFAVQSIWPYLLGAGPLSWLACYLSGVHPALALVPIVPFLPHTARDVNRPTMDDRSPHTTPSHLEMVFRYPVQAVAFFFALVNTGVLMRGFGTGTWALLCASLVGRPVGILAAAGLTVAAGLRLPRAMRWQELVVITLAASPGLTIALFLATAVFPTGPLLNEMKIGALSTAAGALPAVLAARLLHVGRFARILAQRPQVDVRLTQGSA